MGNILVVDDTAFWRDTTADALRLHAHNVVTAADGTDALTVLKFRGADLIILDVEMPQMQGLSFLEQIRREDRWKELPVIMLTGDMQKDHIMRAKKLGAVDYLLKSRFSPQELLDRVQRRLEPALAPPAAANPVASLQPAPIISTALPSASLETLPLLLTREKCLHRATRAMSGRTLAGVVAEVILSANSPRINLSELTTLLARDAMLAVRVLHASNSASNVTARGAITTLADAVRVVGCTTIRDIAASIGIIDAMPQPEADGFNPIRTWQHSLAVAKICEQLAPAELKASAHLVGLCHDLGDVLFRTHFGAEYIRVLAAHKSTGQPIHRIELQMLGATHGEISKEIVRCLGLPENISHPIELFHHAMRTSAALTDPLAQVLRLADSYATGVLLASSPAASVCAFTQTECRDCSGQPNPVRPNDAELRGEILALTTVYARLPAKAQKEANAPLFGRTDARLLVVRDPALSSFDPLTAALQSLAEVTVVTTLPSANDLSGFQGLVVIARNTNIAGLAIADVDAVLADAAAPCLPVLFISGKQTAEMSVAEGRIAFAHWPLSVESLAAFVNDLS